ncbi:hypothetical protein N0V90_012858 [Kalmusia sp. IMI 367209]|nr:hypothetical protein N0V90_012858 [Kalmusia sp. IMI 367209]
MSAMAAVISIPELLQQILSELPPLDIIRYQRVSRTWKELISSSPLLQYKAWLRHDFPGIVSMDPFADVLPESWELRSLYLYCSEDEQARSARRFIRNISQHLNPVLVARTMQDFPDDTRHMYGGEYLSFRPVLIQSLMNWHEANKDSKATWADMPLCRPETDVVRWETNVEDEAGVPFTLQARYPDDPEAQSNSGEFVAKKQSGEPLLLTLGDLLEHLPSQWERWIDWEDFMTGILFAPVAVSDEEHNEADGQN